MDQYQFLTMEIKVPSDWPVQVMHKQITKVVKNAITNYLSDQRVVVTVGNISALVTQNESGDGYFFKRIQEIPNARTYGIYLILPTSILMQKPNSGESNAELIPIPLLAENLKFHSVAPKSFQTRRGISHIEIAVPNIKKILQSKDMKGDEKYKYVFKSTYRVHESTFESIQLSTILKQFMLKQDPVFFHTKISDDEWDMVCKDQIPKPLLYKINWKSKNSTRHNDSH